MSNRDRRSCGLDPTRGPGNEALEGAVLENVARFSLLEAATRPRALATVREAEGGRDTLLRPEIMFAAVLCLTERGGVRLIAPAVTDERSHRGATLRVYLRRRRFPLGKAPPSADLCGSTALEGIRVAPEN